MFSHFYFTTHFLVVSRIRQGVLTLLYQLWDICSWVRDKRSLLEAHALEEGEDLEFGRIYIEERRNKYRAPQHEGEVE